MGWRGVLCSGQGLDEITLMAQTGESDMFRVVSSGLVLASLTLTGFAPASRAAVKGAVRQPLPVVARSLGPPPSNCQTTTLVHPIDGGPPAAGGSAGGGELVAYSGWSLRSGHAELGFAARTKYGFATKIFWQLMHGSRGPVSLHGWNLRTGQPIWFGVPLSSRNLKQVYAWPSGIVRHLRYNEAPTLAFVPAAGCYVLQARWAGGGWSIPFGAGLYHFPGVQFPK